MIFSTRNFDQKVPLSDTSQKNHLNHFGQVVFNMTNLTSGIFLQVKWWIIWVIKLANKNFGQQVFWVNF